METFLKTISVVSGVLAGYLTVSLGAFLALAKNDAKKGYRDRCEYLMILGGAVKGEDTPSLQLTQRINCAVDYLKENPCCVAVPCGGCFRKEQKVSEAQIIKNHLVENGIDENRIILEDKSTTTAENFKFAAGIIKNHSAKKTEETKIAFLTSDFHIYRATLIAKRCGLDNPLRVSCPSEGSMVKEYLREYVSAYELLNPNLNK